VLVREADDVALLPDRDELFTLDEPLLELDDCGWAEPELLLLLDDFRTDDEFREFFELLLLDDVLLDEDFLSIVVLRLRVELFEPEDLPEERIELEDRESLADDFRRELVESLSRLYELPLVRDDPVVYRLPVLRDEDFVNLEPEYRLADVVMVLRISFLTATCFS